MLSQTGSTDQSENKMKKLFILAALVLTSAVSYAEVVQRHVNESLEDFAERNAPPESHLVHQVIESTVFKNTKSVIAFYEEEMNVEECQGCRQIVGYIYLSQLGETYEKVLIHQFETEGGSPRIESVFFANANKDPVKEIIVIVSWPVDHYDVSGTLYGTYIFGPPQRNSSSLTFLKEVSAKLDGGCECWQRDGPQKKAKYKTAAEVKAGLREC